MSKTIKQIQQEINAKKQAINKIAGSDEKQIIPDPLQTLETILKTAQKEKDQASKAVKWAGLSLKVNQLVSYEKVQDASKQVENENKKTLDEANRKLKDIKEQVAQARQLKSELDALERQYKALEQEGEKILKSEEANILNKIINNATVNKINGVDEKISNIATKIAIPDLKDKLTESQITRLQTLKDNLSGKSEGNKEIVGTLEAAINKEVDKGVSGLKNSKVWKDVEGALDLAISAHIHSQTGNVKNNFSKGVESNYEAIKGKITLEFNNGKFAFTSQNEEAQDILAQANTLLEKHGKGLQKQFNEMIQGVQNSPEVQNLWQKIVEAIKELFKGHVKEAGQKVNEASKNNTIKKIISSYNKQSKREKVTANKSKQSNTVQI